MSIYAKSTRGLKHMKKTLTELKEETDSLIFIIGDCNIPLLIMDRKTTWKINNEIEELNKTIEKVVNRHM